MSNDLEYGQLIAEIYRAALGGHDQVDLMREYTAKIQSVRNEAVAAALDTQASFYWESSTLLDPACEAARAGGDESMEALLTAQIKIMREVSARLRRRAAEIRGVSSEEAAARALLEQPEQQKTHQCPSCATGQCSLETAARDLMTEQPVEAPTGHECCSCCTEGACSCAEMPEDARCECAPCQEKTVTEVKE